MNMNMKMCKRESCWGESSTDVTPITTPKASGGFRKGRKR